MPNPPHTVLKPTDAMIEAGKGAWLDKRGFSDKDVLTAIYLAMEAARPEPQQDVVERAVNDFAVKVTEHAIMELDADEENTAQIEAFGALVEQEFRAAIQALQVLPKWEEAVERLTAWSRKHSDVTPLDGTDRYSPTFGDLRALLKLKGECGNG